jgi:lipoprotein-anchoring transpeptidase ErfK/SrfK
MVTLYPAVTDSSQLVSAAQTLLTQPLALNLYDPFTGNTTQVSTPPEVWAAWLTAQPDHTNSLGVRLSLEDRALRAFISQADAQAGDYRYLKTDEIAVAFQEAVRGLRADARARVYHEDRPRVVQAGETIISIAYDEGVPYPWIQKWNGNISNISVGQTIMIPSADNFFEYEPIPHKRVIVSISQQRAWVYENGTLKWEWTVSTGINDSPTWPGVYQIISHYPNAYAGNWNLYMPWFMGVYQPIPGADFTNGFHGYPTRGGGQILWRNNLGTKVTYGCILLDDANARQLYEWAEEGVVVEIQA